MYDSGRSLSGITTLAERKRNEAARRMLAAQSAVDELRDYAIAHRGRYVAFGSYVSGTMRFDSDLDVMVDFPADQTAAAWQFAEEACVRNAIPLDIHDARTTTAAFRERVLRGGLVLS